MNSSSPISPKSMVMYLSDLSSKTFLGSIDSALRLNMASQSPAAFLSPLMRKVSFSFVFNSGICLSFMLYLYCFS